MSVNLGDRVKDPVTGIEGIAYSRTSYLQGCNRIGIQEKAFKDNKGETKVPDLWYVDEPQLVITKEFVVTPNIEKSEKDNGGPSRRERDSKR